MVFMLIHCHQVCEEKRGVDSVVIEDQSLFRSYDWAPRVLSHPLHPSPIRKLSLYLSLPV